MPVEEVEGQCHKNQLVVAGQYLVMEAHTFDVVKDVEEVGLDGVRVGGLAQDLQERGVRHEEETREQEALLLQVAAVTHTTHA